VNVTDVAINTAIAVSMGILAICFALLVGQLIGLLAKGRDTLGAVERLADTLQQEVGPTAVQLREVMDGINQIKGVTTQRITAVTHKVETAADSVATAVDQTKKHSSIWGTGLIAGFQEYLYGKHEKLRPDKQIPMDRGDRHELKQ
jgi:uncharacterized protein YoxC